jgi:Dehydrogenases with different specificities (related to short-chain alcohol dehydrogenases)
MPKQAGSRSRVVLITGAARRLGRHIACKLASEGWTVAVHYRHSVDEANETLARLNEWGGTHQAFQADLSDERETRSLFESCVAAFGKVDAVVNNASLFDFDDIHTFETQHLLRHILPNVAAPIILTQALFEHVRETRPGVTAAVVNLLDQKLGHPNPDFLSYTLSKSALKTATTMLAKATAPHVRVVGVSPGLTLPSHLQTDEEFAKAHRLAPLGRGSDADDIARAVAFLLDSPSITGVDLVVDGGQHLVGMERDFSMMEF